MLNKKAKMAFTVLALSGLFATKPHDAKAVTRLSNTEVAKKVILGNFDNGNARTVALTNAGYTPATIQALVNQLLGVKTPTTSVAKVSTPTPAAKAPVKASTPKLSNKAVAQEVINGKFGSGVERTDALKKAGYNPVVIQDLVNQILGESASSSASAPAQSASATSTSSSAASSASQEVLTQSAASSSTTTSNQSVLAQFLAAGGTMEMWNAIVLPESGGNPDAQNPAGYHGLGQTMQSWGWGSVAQQTQGMISYAVSRYGSVDAAVNFRLANSWW